MKEEIMFLVIWVVVPVIAFLGGIAVLSATLEARQCNNYEIATGKQTRYFTLDACYVSTPQGWQRWDEYKARAVASEGLKK